MVKETVDEHDLPSDDRKTLTLSLEEARKKYDRLNSDYHNLRGRLFTLLAAELAVVTYLFASDGNILPRQLYGIIFFAVGVSMLAVAAVILFVAVSSVVWAVPLNIPELKNKYNLSHDKYLEHMRDDYLESYAFCLEKHQSRTKMFDWSIRLFLIGVTILLILKFGG